MSDFFMFNETIGKRHEEKDDLEGFEVRASDGKVGTVMDVCDRPGESFIVVNTGRWLLSKKVVLPAGVIDRVDHEGKVVHVNRPCADIKAAPAFDESFYRRPEYHKDLERHYSET
ncbi:MAG: hypothetical protein AVDCRST_MAG69-1810 [uncultured Solirubrobacteraceae bacterium]|uniref:PRC-barrel domain-containing protein n=1 Tax=uncultured Solirubrobacteraceae bacterium TaxID=1162706 RepID=A0A6J4SPP1_9ACTN|nr:MAG: hypothetical protein AVDCRST_MAG69-1810 [uncultured Solirubrobacteraceae bacterium]